MHRHAARLAALALALVSGRALAGEIVITPVLVELGPAARTAILSVRNASSQAMRYQVKGFAWDQSPEGKMLLEPTRDLVLFPPLLELKPGESRNVRVGTTVPAGDRERSWRVFVEEMPRADQPESNQVKVLTRVGIPVFLAPSASESRGEIALLGRDGGHVRFALRNLGTVRLRPLGVRLALLGKDGSAAFERALEAWYVLAGGERVYEVEVPADACARAEQVAVTATLESGTIEARAPGACRGP